MKAKRRLGWTAFLITCLAAVFSATRLLGQKTPAWIPADVPVPRTDRYSRIAHAQLLEKAKKGGIDVYFEGDSIVRRWGATDYPDLLAHWNRNFFGWNAADFGWGSDSIQNILWRLNHGELDGVHPKVIVLLAGTNNVDDAAAPGGREARIEDISRGLQAILGVMEKKAPRATLIVTGIFPRNDNMALMPLIDGSTTGYPKWPTAKKSGTSTSTASWRTQKENCSTA